MELTTFNWNRFFHYVLTPEHSNDTVRHNSPADLSMTGNKKAQALKGSLVVSLSILATCLLTFAR